MKGIRFKLLHFFGPYFGDARVILTLPMFFIIISLLKCLQWNLSTFAGNSRKFNKYKQPMPLENILNRLKHCHMGCNTSLVEFAKEVCGMS